MLLSGFFDLPPKLMAALGTVIGFALMDDLTADQQNSLGNFLMLISQLLETSANQKILLQDLENAKQSEQLNQTIQQLISDVAELKKRLPPET